MKSLMQGRRHLLLLNLGSLATAEWLPTDIGGCVLWLRSDLAYQDAAKTVPCVADSLIWTGENKSGLGHDVVQATEAKRPIYLTNQVNGLPAWDFDTTDDYLKAVAFTWNQPEVIYLVLKSDLGYVRRIMDGNGTDSGTVYTWNPPINSISMYAGSGIDTGLQPGVNTWFILRIIFNGANSSARVNNGTPVTGDAGTSNMGGFTLGMRADGITQPFDGQFAEVIGYNAIPSDANDTLIMDYLTGRYL